MYTKVPMKPNVPIMRILENASYCTGLDPHQYYGLIFSEYGHSIIFLQYASKRCAPRSHIPIMSPRQADTESLRATSCSIIYFM